MSGAFQMRANKKRANENCASSGIPVHTCMAIVFLREIKSKHITVFLPGHRTFIYDSKNRNISRKKVVKTKKSWENKKKLGKPKKSWGKRKKSWENQKTVGKTKKKLGKSKKKVGENPKNVVKTKKSWENEKNK